MGSVLLRGTILLLILTFVKGSSELRVVGGYEAPKTYGRFHASLQNLADSHVCGGTVISAHYILTAAHCVYGTAPEFIRAVVGTTNLNKGGQQYNVSSIIIHERFDYHLKINDIAILKIYGFFDIRVVDFLKISSDDLIEKDLVILSGFGSQEPNSETSPLMYALDLTVFNQETCKYAMRYTRDVYDEMFCTFTKIGEGTCHGDSGGPLIKDGMLVGLVSWGIPCAVGFPDVHTRIAPYILWIQEKIKKTEIPAAVCKTSL